MSIYHICRGVLPRVFIISRAHVVPFNVLTAAFVLMYSSFKSYPLNIVLIMAGVVKFSNPLYNSQFVQDVLNQIASLPIHGTMIVEHRSGRVSNVDYSGCSESEIMNIARAFLRNDIEVVCVRLPRFNVVMYNS